VSFSAAEKVIDQLLLLQLKHMQENFKGQINQTIITLVT
jgi:hypothetical protein